MRTGEREKVWSNVCVRESKNTKHALDFCQLIPVGSASTMTISHCANAREKEQLISIQSEIRFDQPCPSVNYFRIESFDSVTPNANAILRCENESFPACYCSFPWSARLDSTKFFENFKWRRMSRPNFNYAFDNAAKSVTSSMHHQHSNRSHRLRFVSHAEPIGWQMLSLSIWRPRWCLTELIHLNFEVDREKKSLEETRSWRCFLFQIRHEDVTFIAADSIGSFTNLRLDGHADRCG